MNHTLRENEVEACIQFSQTFTAIPKEAHILPSRGRPQPPRRVFQRVELWQGKPLRLRQLMQLAKETGDINHMSWFRIFFYQLPKRCDPAIEHQRLLDGRIDSCRRKVVGREPAGDGHFLADLIDVSRSDPDHDWVSS
jgi:hypothetical protein